MPLSAMRFHDNRDEAPSVRQQKSRAPPAVAGNKPKKRWSRRRSSKVYLVPYAPTLSPILEESAQGSSCSQASKPLLKRSSQTLSYGVITPRLNRVVIAVEEHDDCGNQLLSSWLERVAKILTLSWLVFSLGVIVLLGGVFLIWLAFVEHDGGGMRHGNMATAFVGIVVVVMAVLFVLWKALGGLFGASA